VIESNKTNKILIVKFDYKFEQEGFWDLKMSKRRLIKATFSLVGRFAVLLLHSLLILRLINFIYHIRLPKLFYKGIIFIWDLLDPFRKGVFSFLK